jgi:hypothetical protein
MVATTFLRFCDGTDLVTNLVTNKKALVSEGLIVDSAKDWLRLSTRFGGQKTHIRLHLTRPSTKGWRSSRFVHQNMANFHYQLLTPTEN